MVVVECAVEAVVLLEAVLEEAAVDAEPLVVVPEVVPEAVPRSSL